MNPLRTVLVLAALAGTVTAVPVVAAPVPGAPASAAPAFAAPSAYGVVDHGERVRYTLAGDCAATAVRAEVTVPRGVVRGPVTRGCDGTVTLPALSAVRATGYREGDRATVALVAGSRRLPLRLQRLEPDQGTVTAGAPTVVPAAGDPSGGVRALAMSTGDVVGLGPVDLDLIESVTVRNSVGQGTWELRVGSASGRAIATGQFGAVGSVASAGTGGWWHSVGRLRWRAAQAVVGDRNTLANLTPAVGFTPEVFLAAVAVSGGPVLVNWVDLNGSGAAELFRFGAEPRGAFTTIFDGRSFDGWKHTGPGRFVLTDGAMRAEHDPGDIGWAWLTYTREQYADFTLRLRFKVEEWDDNGGILWRHRDPRGDPNTVTGQADEMQIMEGFENHTGGIAHETDAERLATNTIGEWNQVELVVVGDQQVIRVNGREVTRRTTGKELRRGFLSVENEFLFPTAAGHVWYDDIRVHRCTSPDDRLCATG